MRKLQATWFVESAEDLANFHGMDPMYEQVLTEMTSWLTEKSYKVLAGEVKQKIEDSNNNWSEAQWDIMCRVGDHDVVSAALQNPKFPLSLWLKWSWVNPDAAWLNPIIPLWALEDMNCFMRLPFGKIYVLLHSAHVPAFFIDQLWHGPCRKMILEGASNKDRLLAEHRLIEELLTSPSTTLTWLEAQQRNDEINGSMRHLASMEWRYRNEQKAKGRGGAYGAGAECESGSGRSAPA